MFITLLVSLLAAQGPSCTGEAARFTALARARAELFNLAAASDAWFTAAGMGCAEADVAAHYLRGLVAARAAYAAGGSAESLEPVKQALAALEARGATMRGTAEVARYVLEAASAAAQSERDQLALLIDHALQLERVQLEAGQGGAPGVTAHEAAGDLFLQVHRYEDARRYYERAAAQLGSTPRTRIGLARTAIRLKDTGAACEQYRGLVTWWGNRGEAPAEVIEARTFIASGGCRPATR